MRVAAKLVQLISGLENLPDDLTVEAARLEATRLLATYGTDAVDVVLNCQNALMDKGNELAAAAVLKVLMAIWEIEDGGVLPAHHTSRAAST